jgi:tetratricopeptide (TPR) repeat protein
MSPLTQKLLDRRVPQYLLVYIGVSWGLIEFTNLIVDVFLLSPHWTKVAIFASLMLWPGYLMVVYNHARPGIDPWLLSEKITVPTNVLVAVCALYFVFRGEDLGAATTNIVVEDEQGNVMERQVAKQEFRKRTILFNFDPQGGLAEDELWLGSFLPTAINLDLTGDDFFDPVAPGLSAEKLRRAGYAELNKVPLSLKRELADDTHAAWILSGTVDKAGDNYVVTVQLTSTSDGTDVGELIYTGTDIFTLVDSISSDLKQNLGIPDRDTVPDLPAEEFFTGERQALAAFGQALHKMQVNNDWAGALPLLQQAVELDPTFTLAQHNLSAVLSLSNRASEAVAPIQAALRNIYRLPERSQFGLKADYYFITQEVDKAWAVVEMWAELYPEDLLALQTLYTVQTVKNQRREAIATLEKMYAINSGLADVLKVIAQLQVSLGDFTAAQDAQQRYMALYPDDFTGLSSLAGIQINMGELATARINVERALLLEPGSTELELLLGRIDHRLGNFAAAEAGIKRALTAAPSAAARMNAWASLQAYYQTQGQTQAAIDALGKRLEEAQSFQPPLQIIALQLNNLEVYLDAGRDAEVRAMLETFRPELQSSPLSILIDLAELQLALNADDIAAAETHLAAVEQAIDVTQMETARNPAMSARARIAGLKGEWEQALAQNRDYLLANPADPVIHTAIAGNLRELGDYAEAERSVRETLRVIPAGANALVELARIYTAQGKVAEAQAALQQALTIWAAADAEYKPAAEARLLLEKLQQPAADTEA